MVHLPSRLYCLPGVVGGLERTPQHTLYLVHCPVFLVMVLDLSRLTHAISTFVLVYQYVKRLWETHVSPSSFAYYTDPALALTHAGCLVRGTELHCLIRAPIKGLNSAVSRPEPLFPTRIDGPGNIYQVCPNFMFSYSWAFTVLPGQCNDTTKPTLMSRACKHIKACQDTGKRGSSIPTTPLHCEATKPPEVRSKRERKGCLPVTI